MSRKKHIALITTWFPPKSGVAVNRMRAFATYLSTCFDVEVFTEGKSPADLPDIDYQAHFTDAGTWLSRLKHRPDDSTIRHHLISAINVAKGAAGYSGLNKWVGHTLRKLEMRHMEVPFDVVISSYAPVEAHRVGMEFKKRFPGVKWIADMRDEMSHNPSKPFAERRKMALLEKEISQYADAVTSVSLPILDDFRRDMPEVGKFREIRNGFDHNFRPATNHRNAIFTLGYFGKFYGEISPDTLFSALSELRKEGFPDMRILMVGTYKTFTVPDEISAMVEILPPLPYKDAIARMAAMDANLLVHPSGKRKGVYTGKLFDYISVAKPVIGIIDPDDVAADLIRGFNCGYIADFYDVNAIGEMLRKAWMDWEKGVSPHANSNQINTLHRKHQVEKLAHLIEELTSE